MTTNSKIGGALDGFKPAKSPTIGELKPLSDRAKALAEGRSVRASFVIEPDAYRQALELCSKHGAPLQQVLKDALDYYLKARGLPGYGDGR